MDWRQKQLCVRRSILLEHRLHLEIRVKNRRRGHTEWIRVFKSTFTIKHEISKALALISVPLPNPSGGPPTTFTCGVKVGAAQVLMWTVFSPAHPHAGQRHPHAGLTQQLCTKEPLPGHHSTTLSELPDHLPLFVTLPWPLVIHAANMELVTLGPSRSCLTHLCLRHCSLSHPEECATTTEPAAPVELCSPP